MINKILLSGPYSYIRKLDYYVLKSFLFALTISILALLGLYIVIHFFTNISDFIEITQQEIFIFIPRYYLIRLPIILYKLIPIMMLIAVMIAISRLMKTRELIAMLSAGIGIHRIVLPIFIAVLVIIGIMYFISESIMPYLGKYLTITEKILKSEGSDRFLTRSAFSETSPNAFGGQTRSDAASEHRSDRPPSGRDLASAGDSEDIRDNHPALGGTKSRTSDVSNWVDLLLIDGGKGHVNAAAGVLSGLGITGPVIAGLAKGKKRETVYLLKQGVISKIRMSNKLRLLAYVRDEAHRFAQKYHHLRRSKEALK